uniref:Protein FAR1-RELATED SEQUENCE n=1 Tax=Hordeum vulgare subsp. vulgare TaxID=112509 RepID=A0A8I6WED3_HORVV
MTATSKDLGDGGHKARRSDGVVGGGSTESASAATTTMAAVQDHRTTATIGRDVTEGWSYSSSGTTPSRIQCLEGHVVFSESMSMNPTLITTGHPKVLHPVLANNAMCESSRERMTPSKSNDTSNMFTDDTDKNFIDVDKAEENCVTDKIVPKEGLCFHSEEEAYNFYNAYAKKKGFSVRWTHRKTRADDTLCARYLVCNKEGVKGKHSTHETRKERACTRTSCKARVHFHITPAGVWIIQKIIAEHNHQMVSPDKVHMLRSQRQLQDVDKQMINHMTLAGIRPSKIYNYFEEWCTGAENVPFLEMDSNNYITRKRIKYLETKDAQTLVEYLKNKQAEDPSFFYAVQLNKEDGTLANFFWADGQSIMDYSSFGDVISFDTTFSTNKFEMPFAPLLGLNHHMQTIVFGAAIIFDETTDSFVWLFSTFLQAMSGKEPKTIFTDQCVASINAIGEVFPNTSHRLCLWHLYKNVVKHLSHVIANHPEFLSELKECVYQERSVARFELRWHALLVKYNLEDNSWINNMFKFREKWATVYRRDSFNADMTSTQRSEGMKNAFKTTFNGKLSLSELLEKYYKCVTRLRRKEKYEDYKSRYTDPVLCIPRHPLLKAAATSYTRSLYAYFEAEFQRQFTWSCTMLSNESTIHTYNVKSFYREDGEQWWILTQQLWRYLVLASCMDV